ncbi:hypothetical protein AAG570_000060 [Ranatra chinensis]|uniref:Cerebellar degeneration-related protein 2-like n=1 Tax=Ranatra chinensis TaxID=642074 RepID=A0ABD0ZCX3_9HEMI
MAPWRVGMSRWMDGLIGDIPEALITLVFITPFPRSLYYLPNLGVAARTAARTAPQKVEIAETGSDRRTQSKGRQTKFVFSLHGSDKTLHVFSKVEYGLDLGLSSLYFGVIYGAYQPGLSRGAVSILLDMEYEEPICLSVHDDLQLAAELGKTLLERNKELEATIRQHQNVVDDQAQEIEYLRKQTAALREVNDSRLRIYEQLEVSIQDLEHTNHRLATQSTADKKHIASLESQIEKLETKCEELQRRIEEKEKWRDEGGGSGNRRKLQAESEDNSGNNTTPTKEEVAELRSRNCRLSSRLRELQSTIDTVTQENMRLEEQLLILQHKQEELTVLEQVRQGEVCCRCLRSQEEISLTGDEDEQSVIDSLINDDHIKESFGDLSQLDNPYRTLVEKYEALLRVQRSPVSHLLGHKTASAATASSENNCMSLQEELQMSGEFSTFHREEDADSETDIAVCTVGTTGITASVTNTIGAGPGPKCTPTADFSETETSSGFSDETINKATQTEAHVPPGAFLCSISDGDDCKFSIYDEANAIDSRFRKTPEYRRLFREIFDVLKRAAEAKDEGETLPLLEDMTPIREQGGAPSIKAPPVTPAHEHPPSHEEVEQSQQSSSTKTPSATPEISNKGNPNGDQGQADQQETPQPIAPQRRDILEHLSQGVGGPRKHHRSRRQKNVEFATTLNGVLVSTRASGRRKRDGSGGSRRSRGGGGDSGRSTPTAAPEHRRQQQQPRNNPWFNREQQYQPPPPIVSSASQEVAKLKQLEKSYAEVLRIGRERVNRK